MKALPKVFVSEPINIKGIELLKDKVQFVFAPDTKKDTALQLIADADAAILRATTVFDKEVIDRATDLKVIARTGVGVDNVDLEFAAQKGILVCNTPGTNDNTVAEHVLTLIFAMSKQIFLMDKAVRTQQWSQRFSSRQIDVKEKILGIIGFGKTGRATAKLACSIGMKVLVYDPFVPEQERSVRFVETPDPVFSESDFVSLHCPVTPETRGFINQNYIKRMKKEAYLINASRGELVNDNDLVTSLRRNDIAGAALDVFREEPLSPESPYLQLDNVILSPHVAGSTRESNERIAISAAQAVLDVLNGKMPTHICNLKYFSDDDKTLLLYDRAASGGIL
ncbi:hydroxyacid dehydrogenase [Niabella aquatica]